MNHIKCREHVSCVPLNHLTKIPYRPVSGGMADGGLENAGLFGLTAVADAPEDDSINNDNNNETPEIGGVIEEIPWNVQLDQLRSVSKTGNPGKYSKRRRSNVAVFTVRIVFISSFLFYCLLSNHSFPTNPNRITNCFN